MKQHPFKTHLILCSIIAVILILISSSALALTERWVTHFKDENDLGTLRRILLFACDEADDDVIYFGGSESGRVTIDLQSSLVIPEDCLGTITIKGHESQETIIDGAAYREGGETPGDSCLMYVYSNGNSLEDLTLINNQSGAGVCFFGQNNTIKNSFIGQTRDGSPEPNRYGVVVSDAFLQDYEDMDASGTVIQGNAIAFNESHGLYLKASAVTVEQNQIVANGGCPDGSRFTGHETCVASSQDEGFGIYIADDQDLILIGGQKIEVGNVIQFNRSGGVILDGDNINHVTVSHNLISRNYGSNLDLQGDGVSINDTMDYDLGANNLMNYLEHVQVFELHNGELWVFGASVFGSDVELYGVHDEEVDLNANQGGGDAFVADSQIQNDVFFVAGLTEDILQYDALTFLMHDAYGRTSEYSFNVILGDDQDVDGIADAYEDTDSSSSSSTADTDSDGLPDAVEDKNRNGIWDQDLGESSTQLADSDGDGVGDYIESRGDGVYDAKLLDTNSLIADSDSDGLTDGEEDKNGNGIIEFYLGESFPYDIDSDDDGVADGQDNCPHIHNPGQDDYYCS